MSALAPNYFNQLNLSSTLKLYPLPQLGLFLQMMREKIPAKTTIQYLVDHSGKIWFHDAVCLSSPLAAAEQRKAYSLTLPRCIAAGNITFSADYHSIVMINNASDYFNSSLDSLKWPLAILVANESCLADLSIVLATAIDIEQFSLGGAPQDLHTLQKDDLTAWFMTTFNGLGLTDQPTEAKELSYQPRRLSFLHVESDGDESGDEQPASRVGALNL